MPIDCVTNPVTHCVDCPEIAEVPAIPPHVETRNIVGWNAGANSISIVARDLFTRFSIDGLYGGIVIGLRGTLDRNWMPELIEHGFYFQTLGGRYFAETVELGHQLIEPIEVTFDTVFEIRRVGARVYYFVDGVLVYSSLAASSGPKVVNCCMYSSGDSVA